MATGEVEIRVEGSSTKNVAKSPFLERFNTSSGEERISCFFLSVNAYEVRTDVLTGGTIYLGL